MYVAYAPELDVSSCATTRRKAEANLRQAVRLFIEEAARIGTLNTLLDEAGYVRRNRRLVGPRLVAFQRTVIPVGLGSARPSGIR